MKIPNSKLGLGLGGVYILLSIILIGTQGLFGESFIALILGLPWSLLLALIEYGHASGVFIYILLLGPIALNAYLLYWIGSVLSKK
jgi:hypothetical protein